MVTLLHHHGDDDLAPDLVDLAVNVRDQRPPRWLLDAILDGAHRWGAYPDASRARRTIAEHHGLDEASVLPTAGGAEAFTLIARAVPGSRPVVVHPQFTEPEASMRAAGRPVEHVVLRDFILDPALVPDDADLVFVGNPTNPTGALHPASMLAALWRPGRTIVVDEAFMDFVPGEPESVLDSDMRDLLVVRSLTKMWSIAGLRAGWVAGDPSLISAMEAQQTHWSVSTPALTAMEATSTPAAAQEVREAAEVIGQHRDLLVRELARIGLPVAGSPKTPFVLVDTSAWAASGDAPDAVRLKLREAGFAARRGDTFRGLGPQWMRLAVRGEQITSALIAALEEIRP